MNGEILLLPRGGSAACRKRPSTRQPRPPRSHKWLGYGHHRQPRAQARQGARAHPPRVKLDTIDRVRRELARLYTEGRDGRRDVADVSKLASVLAIVARLIEDSENERRLEALEAGFRAAGAKP